MDIATLDTWCYRRRLVSRRCLLSWVGHGGQPELSCTKPPEMTRAMPTCRCSPMSGVNDKSGCIARRGSFIDPAVVPHCPRRRYLSSKISIQLYPGRTIRIGNEKEASTVNACYPLSFNAVPSLDKRLAKKCSLGFVCVKKPEAIPNFQLQCHDINAIITQNISFLAYYSSQRELLRKYDQYMPLCGGIPMIMPRYGCVCG